VYLGKDDTVEFVASSGPLAADDEPIDVQPDEFLLAFFGRIEVSNPRLAALVADLPAL
jgi:hypothetical protein